LVGLKNSDDKMICQLTFLYMHITTQTDVVLSNKNHGCQKIYHVTIIEMVHENSKDVQRRIDDNRKTMGGQPASLCKESNSRKMFSYSIYLAHLSNSISPLEP
jgi:hypothetical protein